MEDEFDDDEKPTTRLCVVCEGEGMLEKWEESSYSFTKCPWCRGTGRMTSQQLFHWTLSSERSRTE
jgi:DnaJ-class molecular chaperone